MEFRVSEAVSIVRAVVDPVLIDKLTELMIDKSPIHIPMLSTHSKKKALSPLIGLETGSVRMAKPFEIEDWPSVFVRGLETLNRNNWFPVRNTDRG